MCLDWVEQEMKNLDLQDKRLNTRLKEVLSMLASSPNESIPAAVNGGHNETTAAYRLFDNPRVAFEDILAPHIDATWRRMSEEAVVVLAQDTSELDLTRPDSFVQGAGPLDGSDRRGELLHPLIAFTPNGTPLGTVRAELWVRDEEVGKADDRKKLPIEEKESCRWLQTQEDSLELASEIPTTQFVTVADSEADIYEVIDLHRDAPNNFDWIIRACYDRSLTEEITDAEGKTRYRHLREAVLAAEILFTQTVQVRGRKLKVSCDKRQRNQPQTSRMAEMEVRATTVTLRAVSRRDRVLEDATVNVVLVRETDPPPGESPVEWLLLTSLPVLTEEDVLQIIQYYCIRWLIEIFFRTLKSGCRVEERRFETIERFERCLAVYMVVAWRTLYACRLGREYPEMSCEVVFPADEWRPVYWLVHREPPPDRAPTLQAMVRMVARLGGYVDRVRPDEPGPQTTMYGMQRLRDIADCWRAFGPEAQPAAKQAREPTCV
jgi:hypothetical protein